MPLTARRRLGLAAAIGLVAALVLTACPSRTAVEYRLPDGFRGWATIQYEEAACPPLARSEGRVIVQIDAAGRGCTSSSFESGEAADSFFLVRGGQRTPLPADAAIFHHNFVRCSGPNEPERQYERFFVGKRGEPRPPLMDPCFEAAGNRP